MYECYLKEVNLIVFPYEEKAAKMEPQSRVLQVDKQCRQSFCRLHLVWCLQRFKLRKASLTTNV